MINYKNADTDFEVSEKEVREHLCMLVIFCDMNSDSEQVKTLKNQLEQMEAAVNRKEFIN